MEKGPGHAWTGGKNRYLIIDIFFFFVDSV